MLPKFSKILEKIFYTRLDDFIRKDNVLYEQQYGFRANRTTLFALTEFVEEITMALENNYAGGVFLDHKKAFDTVDHDSLKRLQRYGIRGIALS